MSQIEPPWLAFAADLHSYRGAVTVNDLGEMLANNGMDGVKCSTKTFVAPEQHTTRLSADGWHSGRETTLFAEAWTGVGVPNESSQGFCNSYLHTNSDHVVMEYFQLSPPPSDNREMSSNSPKSSSSSEELTTSHSLQRHHHAHIPGIVQRPVVRKQHSITFRNARQSVGGTGDHSNSAAGHADSSDDEKIGEETGKVTHHRLDLASGHRQTRKVPQDPCSWNAEHVQYWLSNECRKHNVSTSVQEMFHMNGKGLILIGLQGFQRRIPQGGHLFYRDLQRLLRMQHNREHQWRRPMHVGAAEMPQSHTEAAAAAV